MERDDPNREFYLKGLTLRNSLNLSVLAFGVADLAMGVGAVIIVMGLSTVGLGALAMHGTAETEEARGAAKGRPTTRAAAMASEPSAVAWSGLPSCKSPGLTPGLLLVLHGCSRPIMQFYLGRQIQG